MVALDNVGVLDLVVRQPVGVVRQQHFPLADDVPGVAVGGAIEGVELVVGAQAIGAGAGVVVGHVGGAADAALAGVVQPGPTGFGHLVHGLVHQQHVPCLSRRRGGELQEVDDDVVEAFGRRALHVVVKAHVFTNLVGDEAAVGLHCQLHVPALQALTVIAQLVVPDDFLAVFGNRERNTNRGVDQRFAVILKAGVLGVVQGRGINEIGRVAGATGRIDRHLVRVGKLGKQGQGARRQHLAVLIEVGRGDGEQGLVAAGGVFRRGPLAAGRGTAHEQTAFPCRDAAIGVAGFLGAHGRQRHPQLGHVTGGDG